MGDAIINTFRGLGFWRISLLALLLLGAAAAVYGVYYWLGREDADILEEDQQIVAVAEGNLVNQVSISGSLLFPNRETLKFGAGGVVEEIRVEEGDYVEEGQVIAVLDVETIAALREDIDDARVKIQDVQDSIEDLNNPYTDLDVVLAEEKIVKARVALRDAEDALEDLLAPPDLDNDFADAQLDLEKAGLDLAKAEDALAKLTAPADSDDVQKAAAKLDSIEASLENARQDWNLQNVEWQEKLKDANEAIHEALSEYRDVVLRFLGADVSENASLLPPREMIADWGTSLEALFTSPQVDPFDIAQHLELEDNPDTPWSEITIQGWNLFSVGSIIPACEEDALLPAWQTCVSRELDAAWEKLDEARAPVDNLLDQYNVAISKSNANIAEIVQSLKEAQQSFAELVQDPHHLDLESASYDIRRSKKSFEDILQKLEDMDSRLLEKPDPLDVEAKTKAIETADASLTQAEEDLQNLFAPPDPLEMALLESRLFSAELALEAAEIRLASAVVVAPWSGLVASVGVEKGDEVTRNTDVVEIVDPLNVEVDGIIDEIDVLSVRVGDQAVVSMDALPGQALTGVVDSIGAGATNQQGVVTYPIRVSMTVPPELNLIEGLSAVAEVVIQEERGLLIPVQAVMGRLNAPVVQVIDDGVIEERPVTLGISDDFWVIVISGLVEGEQIVFQAPESDGFNFGGFRGGPGSAGFIQIRGGPGR